MFFDSTLDQNSILIHRGLSTEENESWDLGRMCYNLGLAVSDCQVENMVISG